jgi:amino acid transporter
VLLLAGAGISMFGYLTSDILATPRMLFAFARDGMLPRALGRVHPRTRAPHVAIHCYAGLAIVLALTGSFAELAVLATLAVTVPYAAGCAAAWRLARLGVAQAGPPLNFRWLGLAMATGIVSMVLLIALASRAEIIGLAAAISVCVALYFVLNRASLARKAEQHDS